MADKSKSTSNKSSEASKSVPAEEQRGGASEQRSTRTGSVDTGRFGSSGEADVQAENKQGR